MVENHSTVVVPITVDFDDQSSIREDQVHSADETAAVIDYLLADRAGVAPITDHATDSHFQGTFGRRRSASLSEKGHEKCPPGLVIGQIGQSSADTICGRQSPTECVFESDLDPAFADSACQMDKRPLHRRDRDPTGTDPVTLEPKRGPVHLDRT